MPAANIPNGNTVLISESTVGSGTSKDSVRVAVYPLSLFKIATSVDFVTKWLNRPANSESFCKGTL